MTEPSPTPRNDNDAASSRTSTYDVEAASAPQTRLSAGMALLPLARRPTPFTTPSMAHDSAAGGASVPRTASIFDVDAASAAPSVVTQGSSLAQTPALRATSAQDILFTEEGLAVFAQEVARQAVAKALGSQSRGDGGNASIARSAPRTPYPTPVPTHASQASLASQRGDYMPPLGDIPALAVSTPRCFSEQMTHSVTGSVPQTGFHPTSFPGQMAHSVTGSVPQTGFQPTSFPGPMTHSITGPATRTAVPQAVYQPIPQGLLAPEQLQMATLKELVSGYIWISEDGKEIRLDRSFSGHFVENEMKLGALKMRRERDPNFAEIVNTALNKLSQEWTVATNRAIVELVLFFVVERYFDDIDDDEATKLVFDFLNGLLGKKPVHTKGHLVKLAESTGYKAPERREKRGRQEQKQDQRQPQYHSQPTCDSCGREGHTARNCRSNRNSQNHNPRGNQGGKGGEGRGGHGGGQGKGRKESPHFGKSVYTGKKKRY